MLGYLAKRLGYYVVMLLVAVGLSYALASTSLNPRANFEGRSPRPSPASVTRQLDDLGVNPDTPLADRFGTWVGHLAHGNLGQTINNTPVTDEFKNRVLISLRLLVVGTILGTVCGILLGAWTATRQYKFSDRAAAGLSFLVMSIPTFVLALFATIFATGLNTWTGHQIINFTGQSTPGLSGGFFTHLGDSLVHLILPTLTIGLMLIASYSRYQRNTMLDVLGSDYLRTARAKGLPYRKALFKHGLRTALIPMSTFFAYGFLGLLTGATFTELIFGWHGMGEWLVNSINQNDVNSVVAYSLFAAVMVLIAGFLSDILHAALDPRVRHA
ncbi:peptide ABC transporter permease [Mangrovactinospora gilvigrisea]|uniref:Peptide ABC transporter permease n=1 Tax=Mangrovactinospora gilvigrisea TaxID=1428644 RepID=A0A1J7BHF1_9ACTN|nr:ABC transporter permease [Mangrovactinospora gilvigrisea]OIV38123.1 peptide ABC transporter permease [Mangrovactinospora gilvigrisea]